MQIKIKCPNKDCGKTLIVDSEMAGKKGKCSTCEAIFLIPGASKSASSPGGGTVDLHESPSGELSDERKKAAGSGSRKPPKARPGSKSAEKYLDDYVPEPKPRKARGAGDAPGEEVVDYVDYDDYDDDRPRRRGRTAPRRGEEDYADYDDYDAPRRRRDDYYEEDPFADDYYDSPYEEPYGAAIRSGRGRRRSGPNIGLIRAGFLVLAIAGCVLCAAIGFKILAELLILLTLKTLSNTTETGAIIWKIADLIWVLASVAVIVGYSFLLFFPNKKSSLGLTIAALSVGAVNLLLQIFLKTVPLMSHSGLSGVFEMIGGTFASSGSRVEALLKLMLIEGLFVAEMVLVALALIAINTYIRDRYNTQTAKRMIIPAGIYGGVILVIAMFLLILSESPPKTETAGTIWKWVIFLCLEARNGMLLWYFVSYLLLMFNTRNAIPKS